MLFAQNVFSLPAITLKATSNMFTNGLIEIWQTLHYIIYINILKNLLGNSRFIYVSSVKIFPILFTSCAFVAFLIVAQYATHFTFYVQRFHKL